MLLSIAVILTITIQSGVFPILNAEVRSKETRMAPNSPIPLGAKTYARVLFRESNCCFWTDAGDVLSF